MRGSLAAIVGVFVVANLPPAFADSGSLDCDALQRKALALNPAPNLRIAPAEAHFAIPAAYFQAVRMMNKEERLVSSGRLTVAIRDFSPVSPADNPLYLGKGWGDTIMISIEQTGVAKSGHDLLKYFLGQHLVPKPSPDVIGFDVFMLEHGLDTAEELHISHDKTQFLICSTNPVAPFNYCETIVNPVQGENMKMSFSVNHMGEFIEFLGKLENFVSCFSKR